ncbi:MAG: hypothetical protein LBE13_19155, partial [Bacteroidales bacterium]|nr:hypothetical protein [Bacteroidales bacterium]
EERHCERSEERHCERSEERHCERSEATPCHQRINGTEKTLCCWGLLRSCLPRNDGVWVCNDAFQFIIHN